MVMDTKLLISLINNNVVRKGTEVTILRPGRDIGGQLNLHLPHQIEIIHIDVGKNKVSLIGASTVDGKRFRISGNHIIKIDGMDPKRLSLVFKTNGKKRGRKPNPK